MDTSADTPFTWGRRRLLGVLAAAATAAIAVVLGLVLAVYFAVDGVTSAGPTGTPAAAPHGTGHALPTGFAHRDAIAAAPMRTVDATAAQPAPPAARTAPTIDIPAGASPGPAGVTAGFPLTPVGAIGQLAAIEQVVLQDMSTQEAAVVHDAWALPGAPDVAQWALMRDVQSFLGGAQMGSTLDPTSTVMVTPEGAQVKGTDGSDWVLACVLITVRATITRDASMAYGHCERMQWHGGRWMIAPGAAPAPAPSTWPGSDASRTAGWRTWVGGGDD
ncbi:hypothetical protein [Allobranchiibius sp. CTAmp26]|uniref:hypothetical protein n=1 Tax=Allobranchiibius sp. CTAmp26 TaxID=2815214 RepID=UPI001AA0B606|nr:hypothetical protein [Allobranchiibius sp. CTAmp26]MBO1756473.1 hypothetical protein [Allobranchiibius sp. CTAmp26]